MRVRRWRFGDRGPALPAPRPHPAGGAADAAGLRGVPSDRLAVGPSAPLPDLRARRLLRLLAEPPRASPRPHGRAPDRPVLRARRGLALVLLRPDLHLSVLLEVLVHQPHGHRA